MPAHKLNYINQQIFLKPLYMGQQIKMFLLLDLFYRRKKLQVAAVDRNNNPNSISDTVSCPKTS